MIVRVIVETWTGPNHEVYTPILVHAGLVPDDQARAAILARLTETLEE